RAREVAEPPRTVVGRLPRPQPPGQGTFSWRDIPGHFGTVWTARPRPILVAEVARPPTRPERKSGDFHYPPGQGSFSRGYFCGHWRTGWGDRPARETGPP